ncbi:MAG: type I methionyl aminopeptidase [Candidatus Eremiobacteraeota bacterium]|nr:type I methionyl aminopeptidase [Candidatus Eremiobacteraeota bacterium]
MITCKSARELDKMRQSGRVTARALEKLKAAVKPGVTTQDINAYAQELIVAEGGVPAFLGYHGFTGSICTSVNEEIVHGIPGKRALREGDVFKIDIGSCVDGWFSDMAASVAVGKISDTTQRLLDVTQASLAIAIETVRPGIHISDIGYAVQTYVEAQGFAVVRALVGHGIGKALHEEPPVPNYGKPGMGIVLRPGMVLAIEPMVNAGTFRVKTLPDQWTVVTADGSLSSHFEHTVAVTNEGFEILTLIDAAPQANHIPDSMRRAEGGRLGARQTPGRIQAIG